MSKRKEKEKVERPKVKVGAWRVPRLHFFLLPFAFCLLVGCRMDMQDQPRLEAYEKGAIRKPVEGTVARGQLREDRQLYTGKKDAGATGATASGQSQAAPQQGAGNANQSALATYPDAVDTFPFPVTEQIVKRGQERYEIFCAMCHGPTGYGDGMIVRRGFRRPPSYHTDQLRQAPVGHYYDVITNGWGSMPSYAAMIPVADRWAIVAYIRALQLSQNPQGTTSSSPAAAPSPQNEPAINYRIQRPSETGGQR
jgi:mono/diheme cytochrome c family protein